MNMNINDYKYYEFREFEACEIANAMRKCEIKYDCYSISKDLWEGLASLIERLGKFYKEQNTPYHKGNIHKETIEVLKSIFIDLDFDVADAGGWDENEKVVDWRSIANIFKYYGIVEDEEEIAKFEGYDKIEDKINDEQRRKV